jgi:hypothetical protein
MKLLAPALLEPGEDHVGSPAAFDDANRDVRRRNLAIGHIGAQSRLGQACDVNVDPKRQRAPVENGSTLVENLL